VSWHLIQHIASIVTMSVPMLLSAALCLAWTGHARRLKIIEEGIEGRVSRQVDCWNQSLRSLRLVVNPAVAFHQGHQIPLAFHRLHRIAHAPSTVQRGSPVFASTGPVLELERLPPAPPAPPTGGDGGGDGDGSGGSHFLRLVSPEEKEPILNDWLKRTKIYAMMDDFGGNATLAQAHRDAIDTFKELRTFDAGVGMRMLFGYYDGDTGQILALAGVNVNRQDATADELSVSCVAPYPRELNDEDSTVVSQTLNGLRLLAVTLEMTLDETPLKKRKRSRH